MNDKVINTYDNKEYGFSTYFLIRDGRLLEISNFNFEEGLRDCFYVKKLGSNIYPKIFLDIKKDNKWTIKNYYIGDYKDFMEFVFINSNSFICIRGFSKAGISRFIRMLNEFYGIDIKIVRFNRKITEAQYERHLLEKEEKMLRIQERIEKIEGTSKLLTKDK